MTEHVIDLFASQPHYIDHLAPIWRALPEEIRGDVLVTHQRLREHALVEEAESRVVSQRTKSRVARVLCAGYADAKVARRNGWGAALIEHGAGQTYAGKRNGSFAGGDGRQGIGLHLCLNEHVRQANASRYGEHRAVVVGSPHVEHLRAVRAAHRRSGAAVLALSWHWPCRVICEEAFWSWPEWRGSLRSLVANWPGQVIGTSHPRSLRHVAPHYRAAGVEIVESLSETIARADVLAFDQTSAGFEAAACGVPVVLLDSIHWRPEIAHGLRFWRWADIGPRLTPSGDASSMGAQWADAAHREFREHEYRAQREAMTAEVFPLIDGAAANAAAALARWIGCSTCD